MQVRIHTEHGRVIDRLLVKIYSSLSRLQRNVKASWSGLTLEEKHNHHRGHHDPVYLPEDPPVLVGGDKVLRRAFKDRDLRRRDIAFLKLRGHILNCKELTSSTRGRYGREVLQQQRNTLFIRPLIFRQGFEESVFIDILRLLYP